MCMQLQPLCSVQHCTKGLVKVVFWGAGAFLGAGLEGTNELALAFKLQGLQSHRQYDRCNQVKHYVPRRSHKYELYRSDRASTRSADSQWLCSKTKNITEGTMTNLRWHGRGKRWYVMNLLSSSPLSSLKNIKGRGKKSSSFAIRKIGSVVPLPIWVSIQMHSNYQPHLKWSKDL